ncbi:glutamyl-tRNA reductase [Planomonospora venezuelensis]|uniref:Glutamyl-tRNA reductase n=1 Tax=Planomonospora venezuelensis TaxID=1999 RepID=A0A841CTN9_PLAVE|nr:glutamyl-tRNA reductase [Planomonospora venezuelensis]MBB5961191.1 glutamyl-tRNA reductase [Planomonospora venezuelensis]GIM99863.1 glutamyl-tRNA reductase [Planomonospora venezuelensis]
MSAIVVGLSHRTAPVALLERVSVSGDALVKLLHDVQQTGCVAETMVVSTCNRVEVYAVVDRFHAVVNEVSALLSVHSGVPVEQLAPHLYVHYEDRAVEHLFSVGAGLDSMVVGEGQILGQIRQALRLAQEQGTLGTTLNELVQQALRVGKRAHAETGIDRAGASLVGVGLALAERALGPIGGRRALVVGAGSMSALSAATLQRAGVTDIVVVNRTHERAVRLAQTVGGRAARFDDLAAELAGADLVISCTGATDVVITADMIARGDAAAGPGELFLLDLALPRDVDPAVRRLPGVTLVDLESMQEGGADAGTDDGGRAEAVTAVRGLVAGEVAAYLSAERAARVTPTVVALRSKAADVVEAELGRLVGRVPEIEGRIRDEVAQTVRRVVDKLLHEPTVRVKQLAESPAGDHYAEALRELFNLNPKVPDAVRRAGTIDMEVDR